MIKTITGIYEQGVIRPLKKLPFFNRQKVELRIEIPESTAKATKAIIHVHQRVGKLLAESHHFSPFGS